MQNERLTSPTVEIMQGTTDEIIKVMNAIAAQTSRAGNAGSMALGFLMGALAVLLGSYV